MNNDIIDLYYFQRQYLFQLLDNIPEDQAYAEQNRINSAGWLMGHLCAEGIDALKKCDTLQAKEFLKIPELNAFCYDAGPLQIDDNLPSLSMLQDLFDRIYEPLVSFYKNMTKKEALMPPQSELLKEIFPHQSGWLAHHLTTHIAVHIGNLSTWKKIRGLKINGY